ASERLSAGQTGHGSPADHVNCITATPSRRALFNSHCCNRGSLGGQRDAAGLCLAPPARRRIPRGGHWVTLLAESSGHTHRAVGDSQEQSFRFNTAVANVDDALLRYPAGTAQGTFARGDAHHAHADVPLSPGAAGGITAHAAGPCQPHFCPETAVGLAESFDDHWPTVCKKRRPRRADLPGCVRTGLEMKHAVEVR